MNQLEQPESVKQEVDDLATAANSAGELTLFDEKYARSGVIELDSSSGSSSTESTSSDESDHQLAERSIIKDYPKFEECVPDGFDFYRRNKSCIIHKCSIGSKVSNCKLQMSDKYKMLVRNRSETGQKQVRNRSETGQKQVRNRSETGQKQVRNRSETGENISCEVSEVPEVFSKRSQQATLCRKCNKCH